MGTFVEQYLDLIVNLNEIFNIENWKVVINDDFRHDGIPVKDEKQVHANSSKVPR